MIYPQTCIKCKKNPPAIGSFWCEKCIEENRRKKPKQSEADMEFQKLIQWYKEKKAKEMEGKSE